VGSPSLDGSLYPFKFVSASTDVLMTEILRVVVLPLNGGRSLYSQYYSLY
jgi:hypothetical protein